MVVFLDILKESLRVALQQYGPGTVLLILAVIVILIRHERLWKLLLQEKNQEIARIAKERDRFQDLVLSKRLTSGLDEEGNPRGAGGEER
jgi:hypothetical protein